MASVETQGGVVGGEKRGLTSVLYVTSPLVLRGTVYLPPHYSMYSIVYTDFPLTHTPPQNFLHLQFCFRCHICTLRTRMRSRTSLLLSIYKKEKKENLKCTCQTISNSYWLMEQQAFSYNFSLLDNQMCDLSGVTSQRECHVFFVDGNVSLTPSKKYLVAD